MATPLEPNPDRPGGLQSMLARLRGMVQSLKSANAESSEDILPSWDSSEPAVAQAVEESPATVAVPLNEPEGASTDLKRSQAEEPMEAVLPAAQSAEHFQAGEAAPIPEPASAGEVPGAQSTVEHVPIEKNIALCPSCRAPYSRDQAYCNDCGYIFPPDADPAAEPQSMARAAASLPRVKGRYALTASLGERGGLSRFLGVDYGDDSGAPVPVHVIREAIPAATQATAPDAGESDEVLPTFDPPSAIETAVHELPAESPWPSVSWERNLLARVNHPALPAIRDSFTEQGCEYLIEEVPSGRSLWDAWDDPEAEAEQRFGWLKQVAEALQALHKHGALLEALRPDVVVVASDGKARLTDLSDLLPLPLPTDAPLRGSLYTAPELVTAGSKADARADLYSFGAMLYALHVGRELSEIDFERQGNQPKPFIPRFPDVHPLFGRLVTKTFQRNPDARFPTDEAVKEDPSGFTELIRTLETCGRTLDNVRLEIASWTTTGIVRTGNEDAFALLHAVESRQDDLEESALILLADGMGGYEAGEVAAALAIQALRKNLLEQPECRALAGDSAFASDVSSLGDRPAHAFDVVACKQRLKAALKDANKQVHAASRSGVGRRGMGCTAEAVFVNGKHVVVGHVGDSRTYHLHEGRLIQLTRDHTLVSRLVELGTLTPEEAETHPRRNELQQAIGGQPDVEPGLYHGRMRPGDWVVVCSDGVSNHVTPAMLKEMLQSEATSAEMAARRLVNLVNIEGATDNATVVVVRAT